MQLHQELRNNTSLVLFPCVLIFIYDCYKKALFPFLPLELDKRFGENLHETAKNKTSSSLQEIFDQDDVNFKSESSEILYGYQMMIYSVFIFLGAILAFKMVSFLKLKGTVNFGLFSMVVSTVLYFYSYTLPVDTAARKYYLVIISIAHIFGGFGHSIIGTCSDIIILSLFNPISDSIYALQEGLAGVACLVSPLIFSTVLRLGLREGFHCLYPTFLILFIQIFYILKLRNYDSNLKSKSHFQTKKSKTQSDLHDNQMDLTSHQKESILIIFVDLFQLLKIPKIRILTVYLVLTAGIDFFTLAILPVYLVNDLGLKKEDLGEIFLMDGLSYLVFCFLFTAYLDHFETETEEYDLEERTTPEGENLMVCSSDRSDDPLENSNFKFKKDKNYTETAHQIRSHKSLILSCLLMVIYLLLSSMGTLYFSKFKFFNVKYWFMFCRYIAGTAYTLPIILILTEFKWAVQEYALQVKPLYETEIKTSAILASYHNLCWSLIDGVGAMLGDHLEYYLNGWNNACLCYSGLLLLVIFGLWKTFFKKS